MFENTYLICIVRARYKEKQPCERILCWIWDLTGFGSYRLENKSQNIHTPEYIVSCKDNPVPPTSVSHDCQRDKVGRQDILWTHKRNGIPVRELPLAHQNIASFLLHWQHNQCNCSKHNPAQNNKDYSKIRSAVQQCQSPCTV